MRRLAIAIVGVVLAGCGVSRASVSTTQESHPLPGPQRRIFTDGARYLVIEALDDDLLHFEMASTAVPDLTIPLYTTPMVAKTSYAGPSVYASDEHSVETGELRATVAANLCITVFDKARQATLHTLCPKDLESPWKSLSIDSPATRNVYGLGQYFSEEAMDGDWIGRVWDPLLDGYGSRLRGFAGGANNFSMFPIMYALGEGTSTYALFLDQIYKQMWDFRGTPWSVGMWGDQVRWYVMSGADLPDLRRDYMELVGRPPVPPKRSFGLWVSEFGFLNWNEVKGELANLRQAKMPVDGFALDLQWFGGTFGDPSHSRMGSLAFDSRTFPNARDEIRKFNDEQGINLMLIEEPYVSETLNEYSEMGSRGYLARSCSTCGPAFLDYNPWWGKGGMVDYTNPTGSAYWHDTRREALISMGIHDHWADLGEPEQYLPTSWYYGFPELNKHGHADIHNIYGFKWMESIAKGYERNGHQERPFLLSRTGTSGIQRFGAAMWSGDIGTNWGNLKSQMQVQMQMSMSGVDYYGSDVGGFQRNVNVEGGERLYTQWLAASAALDVPVRPHAWNLDNQRPTSPSRRGDRAANLESIRQRYRLSPYYYSLAFSAYRNGDPVFPPLVHYYQEDLAVRRLGSEKMIGRDLLVAIAADPKAVSRDVYLPAGDWVDFHTFDRFASSGETIPQYPLFAPGYLRLPLFARAGAIIPMMVVDDETLNIRGRRRDGTSRNELNVRVFASSQSSSFDLFEDDGETVAYQQGDVATTHIEQQLLGDDVNVVIGATTNSFEGMGEIRDNVVEVILKGRKAINATLNGRAVGECGTRRGVAPCFLNVSPGLMRVTTGPARNALPKEVVIGTVELDSTTSAAYLICGNANTDSGSAVYVSGNTPALGNWDPAKAIRLGSSNYPVWSLRIDNLPADSRIEWKCLKRRQDGSGTPVWQPGANNILTMTRTDFSGESSGSF